METLAAPGGIMPQVRSFCQQSHGRFFAYQIKSIQKERPSHCSSVEVPWAYESVWSVVARDVWKVVSPVDRSGKSCQLDTTSSSVLLVLSFHHPPNWFRLGQTWLSLQAIPESSCASPGLFAFCILRLSTSEPRNSLILHMQLPCPGDRSGHRIGRAKVCFHKTSWERSS